MSTQGNYKNVPNLDKLVALGLVKARPEIFADMTLVNAQVYVETNKDVGVVCPCCDQFAKRYSRKLSGGIAKALMIMCSLSPLSEGTPWVSIKKLEATSREIHKLAYWGLAESSKNTTATKKHSGQWRPTLKGRDFVHGRCSIPGRAITYNKIVEGFECDDVMIWESLGKKFDYTELMNTLPGMTSSPEGGLS